MQRALILYNPTSGRRKHRRSADVQAVERVLREAGVEAKLSATASPEKAAEQAGEAAASGCDTLVACGGDGTINDILQGLVGTKTALGVIPLGTANALAHDLGMPMHPVEAARALLSAEPRSYSVGRLEFRDEAGAPAARYFTVAVGVGADAHLFYKLDQSLKGRWGMAAYYAQATYVWFTHAMDFFEVEFKGGAGESVVADVSELLAVRISNFGGVLRTFAPGASLARRDVRLVLFKTKNRLRYLQYILRAALGRSWTVPGIELENVASATCRPAKNGNQRIYVESDGELVGTLPAVISVVPETVTLLVPKK